MGGEEMGKMFSWREKKGRQKATLKKHSGLRGYMFNHATNIRSGKSFF